MTRKSPGSSWIGIKLPAAAKPSFRGELPMRIPEFTATLRATGVGPVKATIERLARPDCRVRCALLLEVGDSVEFDLPGEPQMTLHGYVLSRSPEPPRFVYALALDAMNARQLEDAEERVILALRYERSRLRDNASLGKGPPTEGIRQRLRIQAEFALQYRTETHGFKSAKAANVSTGGLLIICGDPLFPGDHLELHFTLPSEVLNVYPSSTKVIDLRHIFKPREVHSQLRRPFEDMVLQARVAHQRPLPDGRYACGVSFIHPARSEREEIARYVDAVRHVKLRQKP